MLLSEVLEDLFESRLADRVLRDKTLFKFLNEAEKLADARSPA